MISLEPVLKVIKKPRPLISATVFMLTMVFLVWKPVPTKLVLAYAYNVATGLKRVMGTFYTVEVAAETATASYRVNLTAKRGYRIRVIGSFDGPGTIVLAPLVNGVPAEDFSSELKGADGKKSIMSGPVLRSPPRNIEGWIVNISGFKSASLNYFVIEKLLSWHTILIVALIAAGLIWFLLYLGGYVLQRLHEKSIWARVKSFVAELGQKTKSIPDLFAENRAEWIFLAIVVVATFIIRAFIILPNDVYPYSDMLDYQNFASSLKKGLFFIETSSKVPGYSIIWALFMLILKTSAFHAMKWVGVISGTLVCVVIYFIARTVFGRGAAAIAAVIAVFYHNAVINTPATMSETISIPLTLIAILLMFSLVKKPSFGKGIILGLVIGYAILSRPASVILIALIPLALVWRQKWQGAVRTLLATLVGILIFMMPWTVRNYLTYGYFEPFVPYGAWIMYIGNNPNATGNFPPVEYRGEPPRPDGTQPHIIYESKRAVQKDIREFVQDHFTNYLPLFYRKLMFMFVPPTPFPVDHYPYYYIGDIKFPTVSYYFVLIFSLIGLGAALQARKSSRPFFIIIAFFFIYFLLHLIAFFGDARFRYSAEWVLIIMAAYALYRIAAFCISEERIESWITKVASIFILLIISISVIHGCYARNKLLSEPNLAPAFWKDNEYLWIKRANLIKVGRTGEQSEGLALIEYTELPLLLESYAVPVDSSYSSLRFRFRYRHQDSRYFSKYTVAQVGFHDEKRMVLPEETRIIQLSSPPGEWNTVTSYVQIPTSAHYFNISFGVAFERFEIDKLEVKIYPDIFLFHTLLPQSYYEYEGLPRHQRNIFTQNTN
jgi:4-amino-4-deoxy-L-arabinose transferase-like glycosyltransferase